MATPSESAAACSRSVARQGPCRGRPGPPCCVGGAASDRRARRAAGGISAMRRGPEPPREGGDQDGRGSGPMFGLSKEVGGNQLRVGAFIGDHRHLRGPGEKVDADAAEELALGLGDERIARTDEHVDRRPMPSGNSPKAIAASACTPPRAKIRSAPEVAMACSVGAWIAPPRAAASRRPHSRRPRPWGRARS